ncbi:hypothetical protein ACFL6S_26735, partial [Candidatus Poribacteria bacterium]
THRESPKRQEKARQSREAAVRAQSEEIVKEQELIWHLIRESDYTVDYDTASAMVRNGEYHRTDEEIAEVKARWEAEFMERVGEARVEVDELFEKAKKLTEKRRASHSGPLIP